VSSTPSASSPQVLNGRIERELIRQVYGGWSQYIDGIPFAVLAVVLMSGLFHSLGHASLPRMAAWFVLQLAWSAGAVCLWRNYRRSESRTTLKVWHRQLCVLWFAHGIIWGLVVWTFWDPLRPVGQALICSMILGTMVGAFYTLAPCRIVFATNLVSLLVTSVVGFAFGGGALAAVQAILFPLFAGLIFSYGWQLSGKYRHAVLLRFENEDMAHALALAKSAAEEASRAKSQFLAHMSHELRTPLNAVIGFSEVIRDRVFGEGALDKYSEYAGDVVDSARHLLNLINGVLDLAKIEAGKMAFERSVFPIGDVLAECVRVVQARADEKSLALVFDDACGSAAVFADSTAMRQMVLNLLSNAIKFTAEGEVRLTARLENGVIAITVSDSGCGIPADMLPRLFSPFERADNSFAASQGGTGLGLALVRHLVEAHGGTCAVESTPGKGTVFRLHLPIVRAISRSVAA
jgi:signal transduction histidine kinase